MASVNESGVYSLIFQSRKPEAKLFRKWVTGEVLPSIRRTGCYCARRRGAGAGGYVDLRHVPCGFADIGGYLIRVVEHESSRWFPINEVHRALGVSTRPGNAVSRLNRGERGMAIKIWLSGSPQPAWCANTSGVELLLSSSRGMFRSPRQIKLTLKGLA